MREQAGFCLWSLQTWTPPDPLACPQIRLAGLADLGRWVCHTSSLAQFLACSVAQHHSFWLRNSASGFPIATLIYDMVWTRSLAMTLAIAPEYHFQHLYPLDATSLQPWAGGTLPCCGPTSQTRGTKARAVLSELPPQLPSGGRPTGDWGREAKPAPSVCCASYFSKEVPDTCGSPEGRRAPPAKKLAGTQVLPLETEHAHVVSDSRRRTKLCLRSADGTLSSCVHPS